jgi:hypothetical protein
VGKLLTEADLDGTTVNGSNADLNDPIGWAIRKCGGSVASVVAVADSDVAGVSTDDLDKFFDLAEFRALESISGNLAVVTITAGPRTEHLSDLAKLVEQRLARKRKQLLEDYGVGAPELQAGVFYHDFIQTDEDE